MRRAALLGVALACGGCSVLFESRLPDGCEIEDADDDGHLSPECAENPLAADCDDADPWSFPGAAERCNGFDDDCDGASDEGIETVEHWHDCDLDGAGDDYGINEISCVGPSAIDCPGGGGQWVTTGGDCDDQNPNRQTACGACAQVDFLIVMDTSNSMVEEQHALAMQLPHVVEVLKSGDVDGDGTPDAEPIEDLHVGVITPDLGAGEWVVPTCELGSGDDGLLRSTSGAIECPLFSVDPPFLAFRPEDDAAAIEQFTADWSCLVRAGIGGCGFEQHLEATLKAVTPAWSEIRFRDETLGHADGLNAGFLREQSLLVVLVVSDEDDCSAADDELFFPASPTYAGDLNLRCFQYRDAVHPITRYVSGLLQVRAAEDLIYAVVGGIPEELVPAPGVAPDYGAILADPRLEERVDDLFPNRLAFSCAIPDRGSAFPPRRLLELAEGLQLRGSTTVVSSICSRDAYTSVAQAILTAAVANGARRCAFPPPPM